jgi:hypothetical protein
VHNPIELAMAKWLDLEAPRFVFPLNEKEEFQAMNTHDQRTTGNPSSQPQGTPWQFRLIIAVIGIGVLGLVGKALGLF